MTLKRILPVVSVILVILLGRFLVIGDIQMNHDEIRSISRTFGTPSQIINWQPIDWPPLFYLTLAVYRLAAGFHPLVMRYFSLLWFAISIASVYRLSLHTNNKYQPALLSAAAYATLGMIAFQSTHLRGYIMSMAMYPLAFYLTVRVFENDTTQWRDSILLGIVLAALFYTTYTLVPAVILLGIYTLLAYPLSRILRWWRPAVMAIPLAIPQFWKLANHIIPTLLERESSSSSTTYFDLNPYPNYQWELIESYAGAALPLWGIILLIVIVLIALRERPSYRVSISLALTSIAGVLIAGAIMPYFGLAAPHYSWWAVFPLVVLAGRGLGYLPRPVWQLALVGLLVFPFLRLPEDQRELRYGNQFVTPFEMVFEWLDDHLAPGDVIFVDPYCTQVYEKCGTAEEWEYFQRVYFPDNRLNIVYDIEQTRNVRRVWYLHVNGFHDTDLQAQILEGRIASLFFGPPDFLWQLYEAPPDPEGILYENGMRFHGYEVIDPHLVYGAVTGSVVRRESESVILRLWWSIDEPLSEDYSISTVIAPAIDEPALVQFDAPPQTMPLHPLDTRTIPDETSQWQPGTLYVEERILTLPAAIDNSFRDRPLGIYMTVYQWWDGETINAEGVHETGRRYLRELFVLAYRDLD